jgi:hypothetical protein
MSTHYSAAPLLIEAQLRFRAFKFPENAGVIDLLMPFLIHMGEVLAPVGDSQQMHPTVATGIPLLRAEFSEMVKLDFAMALARGASPPPSSSVWAKICDESVGIRDMVAGQVPGMKWTWSAAANFCVRRLDSGTGPSDAYAPDRFMRSRPFADAPPISKRPRTAAVGQAGSNYSHGQRGHGPQCAGSSRKAVHFARPKPLPGAADWRKLIQPPHPYGGVEISTYDLGVGRVTERHVNYARFRLPSTAA